MMDEIEGNQANYPVPSSAYAGIKSARRRSSVEQLKDKKVHLEAELKVVTEALEALEKNPEFEKLLHLISRAL